MSESIRRPHFKIHFGIRETTGEKLLPTFRTFESDPDNNVYEVDGRYVSREDFMALAQRWGVKV